MVYPSAVRTRLDRRRIVLVALLALVAIGTAWAAETFAHTDDGCPVEIHCLACRLATGTVAVLTASTPVLTRASEPVEKIWTPAARTPFIMATAITPSRAPPLA